MSNLDTVRRTYEAFGRGDVTAILDTLDESVRWDTDSSLTEVPWLKPRRGKTEVAEFFQSLEPLEFDRFEPRRLFEEGDQVFALITLEVTYKPTGKKYFFPNHAHLWRFGPFGQVIDLQHVTDTHLWVRLVRGE